MHWVDIVIALFIVGSAVYGFARGLVIEAGAIVGAVLGLYLANRYYGSAADLLTSIHFQKNDNISAAGFVIVFALVWILVSLVAHSISGSLKFTPFGTLDRVGGLILGAILGIVIADVLLILVGNVKDSSLNSQISGSFLAPILSNATPALHSFVPTFPGVPPPQLNPHH